MEQDRGLPELIDTLRWRWKLVTVIALAWAVGATLGAESLPSKYDGKAVISFAPRRDARSASSDTVRVIVPKYIEYITADATIDRVSGPLDADSSELGKALSAELTPDTGNVTIRVRLPDATRAARVANAFARDAVRYSRRDALLTGEIVAIAVPRSRATFPPRRLLEAIGLLVGMLVGIATAVLLERGRPRLRNWRQIADLTGYEVLGRIPPSRIVANQFRDGFKDPVIASAFRTLRANLEPRLQEDMDVLLVTSPRTEEGKTTVTALLGEAFSRRDLKVVIVDADLRRAELSQGIVRPGKGLAGILNQTGRLSDEIQRGWAPNLMILPTAHADDAGDLLALRFDTVVAELRDQFDIVLIDCPPLLGMEDARTIAPFASGIILVVAAGSPPEPVNEAVLTLEALRAPLLGIVANRIRTPTEFSNY